LSVEEKSGRIRVAVNGQSYAAEWRVSGPSVFVTSSLGEASALLGGLASAPATVAGETLRQMVKAANRPARGPQSDRARFDVKDAFRRS
jgi:hypothetical protein